MWRGSLEMEERWENKRANNRRKETLRRWKVMAHAPLPLKEQGRVQED